MTKKVDPNLAADVARALLDAWGWGKPITAAHAEKAVAVLAAIQPAKRGPRLRMKDAARRALEEYLEAEIDRGLPPKEAARRAAAFRKPIQHPDGSWSFAQRFDLGEKQIERIAKEIAARRHGHI